MKTRDTTLMLDIAGVEKEFPVHILYEFHPHVRGARDSLGGVRGGGPPLEPDEPAHCEVSSVVLTVEIGNSGATFDITGWLSEEQIEAIEVDLMEHEADDGPDPDYERDRDRDRDYE